MVLPQSSRGLVKTCLFRTISINPPFNVNIYQATSFLLGIKPRMLMVRTFPFITSSSYLPPLSSDLHFQFPDATFCLIQNPYPIIHPLSSLLPSLCYHLFSCWFILKWRWQICILPLDLFFCTGIVFLMHSETGLNDPSDWTESIIYLQQGHLTQKCNPPFSPIGF